MKNNIHTQNLHIAFKDTIVGWMVAPHKRYGHILEFVNVIFCLFVLEKGSLQK